MPEPLSDEGPLPHREDEYEAVRVFIKDSMAGSAKSSVLFVNGASGGGKTTTVMRCIASDFKGVKAASEGARTSAPKFKYINCADLSRSDLVGDSQNFFLGRRTKASTGANKTAVTVATLRQSLVDLRSAKKNSLHILILDEAEFAKSPKAVEDVTLAVMRHGAGIAAVILISNVRSVGFLSSNEFEELTFCAYDLDSLRNIGSAAAQDAGAALNPAAVEYAAKLATSRYSADARKMLAMCRTAAHKSARRDAEVDEDAVDNLAKSARRTEVTVPEMVRSIADAPSTAIPVIRALPSQMLLILCCALNYSRRLKEQGKTSGSLDVRGLYVLYQRLMRHVGAVPQSQGHIHESLSSLADYGLITQVKNGGFALICRPDELQTALKAEGKLYHIAQDIALQS